MKELNVKWDEMTEERSIEIDKRPMTTQCYPPQAQREKINGHSTRQGLEGQRESNSEVHS